MQVSMIMSQVVIVHTNAYVAHRVAIARELWLTGKSRS